MQEWVDRIHTGDALSVLRQMPDSYVDCVVTSPPYWGLRDYGLAPMVWDAGEGCEHEWKALGKVVQNGGSHGCNPEYNEHRKLSSVSQFCCKCGATNTCLGLEPTFGDVSVQKEDGAVLRIKGYISHLCDIFDEVKRVLKPIGSCWVNIGTTFYGGGGGCPGTTSALGPIPEAKKPVVQFSYSYRKAIKELPPKCDCMIPERFAIEMVSRGWIKRRTKIWLKPSCPPSSVTDDTTLDFEYVYLFVKQPRYFFEQVFEPCKEASVRRLGRACGWNKWAREKAFAQALTRPRERNSGISPPWTSLGRNLRSVWTIPAANLKEQHYAAFPERLVELPLLMSCPEYVCLTCGKPRKKVYEGRSESAFNIRVRDVQAGRIKHTDRVASAREVEEYDESEYAGEGKIFVGYTDCGCDHSSGWGKGIVLDPFMGSGTTAVVAMKMNRHFVGIEPSEEYVEIARRRLTGVQRLISLS